MKTTLKFLTALAAMALLTGCNGYTGGGTAGGNTVGNAVLTGVGVPSDTIGTAGGLYLDIQSGMLYVKGQDGKWAENSKIGGPAFYHGDKAPDATIGSNGDSYLDYKTGSFYVKENGAWVEKGALVDIDESDSSQESSQQTSQQGGETSQGGNTSQGGGTTSQGGDTSQGGGATSQGGGTQETANVLVKSAADLDGHSFYFVADSYAMSTTPKVDKNSNPLPWYMTPDPVEFQGESLKNVEGLTSFLLTKNSDADTYKITSGTNKLVGYIESTHYSIAVSEPSNADVTSEDWFISITADGIATMYVDLGQDRKVYLNLNQSFCGASTVPTDTTKTIHFYKASA